MTVINVFSALSYLKDSTLREKIQTFALPLIFLVLLYNSPSGLVIYWIFNNLFSLAKNVVKKQKNPAKILFFALFGILAAFCALFWIFKPNASIAKKLILTLAVVIFAFSPKAISFFKSKVHKKNIAQQEDFPLFILSAAGLALLFGLVLPASTVSSDPIAFSFLGNTENPLSYIKNALSLYTGLFVVWGILIYKMFGEKVRIAETKIFAFLLAASLLNSFVFKFDYGTINILFNIEEEILQASYPILNLFAVLAGAAVVSALIFVKKRNFLSSAVLILCIAELALSANDIRNISAEFKAYKANIAGKTKDDMQSDIAPVYHLSREKKNVIVIFIDQAIGAFFPVLQTEHPEITEKFTGFTFFPNTASFGGATLYGSPAMMGGYDYTPENANKRADVPLRQKHNEATLMLPRLFLDSGFDVTVTDPPLPNFTEAGDLSAFKDYPQMHASELKGVYTARYQAEFSQDTSFDEICKKGIVNFSVLQTLMPALRNSFYRVMKNMDSDADDFFASFPSLYYMRNLTAFDGDENTYSFICNETPHFATFLNTENFVEVSFEKDESSKILDTGDDELIMKYHVFTAAIKQLALWLDFLKANDCYDNTRIVIVSDHGHGYDIPNDFNDEKSLPNEAVLPFNPILLFKDFDSVGGIMRDERFMTNADTVFLAADGIVSNLRNPFLGTPLVQEKSKGIRVWNTTKGEHNPMPIRNGKTLTLKSGYFIPTDLFHTEEWQKIE